MFLHKTDSFFLYKKSQRREGNQCFTEKIKKERSKRNDKKIEREENNRNGIDQLATLIDSVRKAERTGIAKRFLLHDMQQITVTFMGHD